MIWLELVITSMLRMIVYPPLGPVSELIAATILGRNCL